jgi:hypothetical protein
MPTPQNKKQTPSETSIIARALCWQDFLCTKPCFVKFAGKAQNYRFCNPVFHEYTGERVAEYSGVQHGRHTITDFCTGDMAMLAHDQELACFPE